MPDTNASPMGTCLLNASCVHGEKGRPAKC